MVCCCFRQRIYLSALSSIVLNIRTLFTMLMNDRISLGTGNSGEMIKGNNTYKPPRSQAREGTYVLRTQP